MIPELGQLALILALQLALLQGLFGLAGAAREHASWCRLSHSAALGQACFVLTGFLILVWCFASHDFSVMNVADHSSRDLPLIYRITAAWGSHEGSFLLWTLLMSGWTLVVSLKNRQLPETLQARVLGILGLLSTAFLAYILFTSNPFLRLHPAPLDGNDLNPLLQDPGMILHPPLLYMGYVGFSIAFAFALAALITGQLDQAWARWVRPWTLVAWSFLTLGIAVGAWWAYYELGWGGWWFWDPSENASLMPWLAGTALVHSLRVTEKRGALPVWSVFLALTSFSLSLLGTFLVRSGVLSSVHAFAQDPLRGLFILIFLSVVIGGSLLLFAFRAGRIRRGGDFALLSKESALLGGNMLLLVALCTVLLGTLYPLLLDALGLGKISVGPPYFNTVFIPIMAPAVLLLGLTPWLRWQQAELGATLYRLRSHIAAALILATILPLALGGLAWPAVLGLGLASWITTTTLAGLLLGHRQGRLPLAAWGMALAHIGLAVGIVGMGLVSAYHSEKTLPLHPGDSTTLENFRFTFSEADEYPSPSYSAMRARIELERDGQRLGVLEPEKRIYRRSQRIMTEAAILPSPFGDVYVALGDPLPQDGWIVQLYWKPFVGWLWGGAGLMALGGLLAALAAGRNNKEKQA